MSIADFAECMRARMPWRVAQKFLASNGFPRGQGWQKTVEKLSDENLSTKEYLGLIDYEGKLKSCLTEHFISGEKLVRFYKSDRIAIDSLRNSILGAEIEETAFGKAFPLTLSPDELVGLPMEPVLVKVVQLDGGIAAVYASVRMVSQRETLERDELTDVVAEELSDYDEIICIRHIRFQAMDIVWIQDGGEFIEVRVDYPDGLHVDVANAVHSHLKNNLEKFLPDGLSCSSVNLFPLIKKIYDKQDEGAVVELAFGTTTASLKHEKMRRQSLDLRAEAYHKGGKQALAVGIDPHHLSVVWSRPIDEERKSAPELTLHTSVRSADGQAPVLFHAVIRNCIGVEDYEFVRERMMLYM